MRINFKPYSNYCNVNKPNFLISLLKSHILNFCNVFSKFGFSMNPPKFANFLLVIALLLQNTSFSLLKMSNRTEKFDSLFEDYLLDLNLKLPSTPLSSSNLFTLMAYYFFARQIQRLSRPSVSINALLCDTVNDVSLGEEFMIESPNFSRNEKYPNSLTCTWEFRFPKCALMIYCPKFHLNEWFCSDFIEIKDSNGNSQRFCGKNSPKLTLNRMATITFKTNSFLSAEGFQCHLKCIAREPLSPLNNVTPSECACGERPSDLKIIGGEETQIGEFPWMALLRLPRGLPPMSTWTRCGGTVITDRHILTAAHCFNGQRELILNEHNTDITTETSTIRVQIAKITPHPLYSGIPTQDYDLAIVHLAMALDLTGNIVPICLPRGQSNTFEGATATVSGWGLTSNDPLASQSPTLQKADLNVVKNSDCERIYNGLPMQFRVTARMMCAYAPNKDACTFDSGGPLMVQERFLKNENSTRNILKYTQIGIAIYGNGCAQPGIPGVYTRITDIMDWILTETTDGSFCKY